MLHRAELRAELEEARLKRLFEATACARSLTAARKTAAGALVEAVGERLKKLAMAKARFAVQSTPSRWAPGGADAIELLFCANVGEPLRPLAKVASGGEASRVMLAIKAALAESDECRCTVFDEADAGVGGAVADVVGRLIKEVSRHRQVLCITHLPQVAAHADAHLKVEKTDSRGRTHATVSCARRGRAPAQESWRGCSRASRSRSRRCRPPRRCSDRPAALCARVTRARAREKRFVAPPTKLCCCPGRPSPTIPRVSPDRWGLTIEGVSAGLTDVGRKRNHNEDSFLIDEELQLFVVADGMGGHAGGGTASRIAVETIDQRAAAGSARAGTTRSRSTATSRIRRCPRSSAAAVERACLAIFTAAQEDPRLAGMGTTVISLLVKDDHAFFAHVGDSRAYLVRGDLIQQISEDHSLVNEQIKAGMITPEEAKHSRYKNIITRSVGFEEEVQVDVMGLVTEPGDIFVLCSDGLANMIEDREMLEVVQRAELEDVPKKLVELANERGGDDNITVIVVQTRA